MTEVRIVMLAQCCETFVCKRGVMVYISPSEHDSQAWDTIFDEQHECSAHRMAHTDGFPDEYVAFDPFKLQEVMCFGRMKSNMT